MITTSLTKTSAVSQLSLVAMGYDLPHLRFYRWLVAHERHPEFVGVQRSPVPTGLDLDRLYEAAPAISHAVRTR